MLDARLVRENSDAIRAAMANRNSRWDIDAFLALDEERRRLIGEVEGLQAQRNESSKAIGVLMQAGKRDEAEAAKEEVRRVSDRITALDAEREVVEADTRDLLLTGPNPPHESVPVGADETENVEIRRWGTPPEFDFAAQAHWDLGPALGILDFDRAVKLAGSRFVLLGGMGAKLNRALISFMLDTHAEAGYKEWAPPVLANAETLTGTGQLPKFEDDLYKTTDGLYLIPTAEVQLTNIHRDEVLEGETLPRLYTAYTPCFRDVAVLLPHLPAVHAVLSRGSRFGRPRHPWHDSRPPV